MGGGGKPSTTTVMPQPPLRPPDYAFHQRLVNGPLSSLVGQGLPQFPGQIDPGMSPTQQMAMQMAQGYGLSPAPFSQGLAQGAIGSLMGGGVGNWQYQPSPQAQSSLSSFMNPQMPQFGNGPLSFFGGPKAANPVDSGLGGGGGSFTGTSPEGVPFGGGGGMTPTFGGMDGGPGAEQGMGAMTSASSPGNPFGSGFGDMLSMLLGGGGPGGGIGGLLSILGGMGGMPPGVGRGVGPGGPGGGMDPTNGGGLKAPPGPYNQWGYGYPAQPRIFGDPPILGGGQAQYPPIGPGAPPGPGPAPPPPQPAPPPPPASPPPKPPPRRPRRPRKPKPEPPKPPAGGGRPPRDDGPGREPPAKFTAKPRGG